MQVAFAEIDYEAFLKVDTQLEAILADLPPWLREGADATGMPPACVDVRPLRSLSASLSALSLT